jgi:hypothetical protein
MNEMIQSDKSAALVSPVAPKTAVDTIRLHWPEYFMEAFELAVYMFLTSAFPTVLQHPASPVR